MKLVEHTHPQRLIETADQRKFSGTGCKPVPAQVVGNKNTLPTLHGSLAIHKKSPLPFRLGAFFSLGDGCSECRVRSTHH